MGSLALRLGFFGSLLISLAAQLSASPVQTLQVTLYWEGRSLEDPNIEALEKLRKNQPDLLITHLLSPSYFADEETATSNMSQLLRVIKPDDQVGLYLSSIEGLMQDARVVMRYQPTFWGDKDERDFCQLDCGLDVPLAGRSREDFLKIFTAAHRSLSKAGFQDAKSYALRGWIDSAVLRHIALGFGYQFDLSVIDPQLLPAKLKSFPFFAWTAELWREQKRSHVPKSDVVVLNGGAVDFSDPRDVLARFSKHLQKFPAPMIESFQLALSQESAYFAAPRLGQMLKGIEEQLSQKGMKIEYQTPGELKNGRPLLDKRHISEL